MQGFVVIASQASANGNRRKLILHLNDFQPVKPERQGRPGCLPNGVKPTLQVLRDSKKPLLALRKTPS